MAAAALPGANVGGLGGGRLPKLYQSKQLGPFTSHKERMLPREGMIRPEDPPPTAICPPMEGKNSSSAITTLHPAKKGLREARIRMSRESQIGKY